MPVGSMLLATEEGLSVRRFKRWKPDDLRDASIQSALRRLKIILFADRLADRLPV